MHLFFSLLIQFNSSHYSIDDLNKRETHQKVANHSFNEYLLSLLYVKHFNKCWQLPRSWSLPLRTQNSRKENRFLQFQHYKKVAKTAFADQWQNILFISKLRLTAEHPPSQEIVTTQEWRAHCSPFIPFSKEKSVLLSPGFKQFSKIMCGANCDSLGWMWGRGTDATVDIWTVTQGSSRWEQRRW